MKKFDKIKRVGHDQNQGMFKDKNDRLVIKEKMDGANFRWTYNEDGKPIFGSKNVEYVDEEGEPAYDSSDYEKLDGRFTNAIEYVREKADPDEALAKGFDARKYTFFGENMVSHSLEYNWEEIPQVLGFDVYDHRLEEWLPPQEVEELFDALGIPTVPTVMNISVDGYREMRGSENGFEIPESRYRDGKAEGVVIINIDKEENDGSGFNTRAKEVSEEFKEKHKEATGANQSVEAIYGHEKIVSKYCTDGRIRKHIEKLRDKGRPLGMELMENKDDIDGLPIMVAKDILHEEYADIVTSNHKVDMKKFRSLVAKRCVHVLKQEVQKL